MLELLKLKCGLKGELNMDGVERGVKEMGEGMGVFSRSETPTGRKGVRESVKCHAPSGRRWAIRMSLPGWWSVDV